MTFSAEQMVSILAAFLASGAVASWVTAWAMRKKVSADAAQVIGTAWQDVVTAQEARVKNLESHVASLEASRAADRAAYDALWERMRKLEEDNLRLSKELQTERALTKRLHEKNDFLEKRVKDLEANAGSGG